MNKRSNYSLCQLNKYSTLLFTFTFIVSREYTEIMDEFLWIVRACVCGNYEKRTELRVVKIRRTVTKRQKFLLTGSKNNYPAERRHISCNYRTTRVRRVNIIARMRPDGIYTEDTHTHIRTRTHVHSVTIARTVIPIPRYRRPESPISNFLQRNPVVHIAAGVTCETLFLLILRDHCFKHRCTSIETINRSRARIRYHNVYKRHARIKIV